MNITITEAKKSDKKAIKRFYRQQRYSASFMGLDTTFIATCDEEIIGAVILSRISADNPQVLLHALVVDAAIQRQGIASALLKQCLVNHHNIRCFTAPRLRDFYTKANFQVMSIQELSEALAKRYQRYSQYESLTIFGTN